MIPFIIDMKTFYTVVVSNQNSKFIAESICKSMLICLMILRVFLAVRVKYMLILLGFLLLTTEFSSENHIAVFE